MIIKSIKIFNFKNIENFESEFSSNINCFSGKNGVGKTNILDAIHYLSFSKSYFNTLDLKNIRHGEEFFAIHGSYEHNQKCDNISCIQRVNQKKQLIVNDKPYKKFADHIGKYPLIMISPYDRDLINLGSDVRRKFADMVISQFNQEYLVTLIQYNKVLLQRNNLLRQFYDNNYVDATLIELLNEQLVKCGMFIYDERKKFFTELLPVFQYYFNIISNSQERVNLEYVSQLNNHDFMQQLCEAFDKDKILKYTTVGVHKDDVTFYINDYSVKNYASQGQQKSFTIALKLAQFDYIKTHKLVNPILLLDDIFDKLDDLRVAKIIELVGSEKFGQVFITDTNADRVEMLLSTINGQGLHFKIGRNGNKQ
ncbi:MAG: DNA replication and repair protein RecF [Bacteroidales bacterium]|jgi:DNA replication and repair protein RecF|nr:DNA replication and repair protein RecF [Bacteroidales bacterium]MDD2204697.1 DNA replication and repair protein RecF [Bacteroidales bacterium]MDD3914074.1 DNA replication and repair protein RecF [Bacteroidales bacterium]MDD4634024.1 DNA replication and repair protein RecF [Bacteroidales bacterium]